MIRTGPIHVELAPDAGDRAGGPDPAAPEAEPMTPQLEQIERLGVSIARSAARLRRYATLPDAPDVFVAHERALLERRITQLREVVEHGADPRWLGEESGLMH